MFAKCCSLGSVGVKCETEDSSVLAPGAQLGRYAFESCLTLATVTFNTDRTKKPRALPEGAFCGAGIEQLCLPHDFHNIGPRACENCKSLVEVKLMSTEITALLSSTFAHCVALQCIWLPPRLIQIGKEAFLNCVVLQEVVIPTELSDIGNRAFCGCEQLQRFTLLDWGDVEQWVQAEHNAFLLERPSVAGPVFAGVFGPQTGVQKNHFFRSLKGKKFRKPVRVENCWGESVWPA